MTKALKKFFIVCISMTVLGFLLLAAGFAGGGAGQLDSVSEKHSWIYFGGGHTDAMNIGSETGESFDKVVVSGDMNVVVQSVTATSNGMPYAQLRYSDKMAAPVYSVSGGVLEVSSDAGSGVYVNLSDDDNSTVLTVYVPSGTKLSSLGVTSDTGDVYLGNVSIGDVSINLDSGDVEADNTSWDSMTATLSLGDFDAEGVTSGAITLQNEYGEAEISGALAGATQVNCEAGDISLTSLYSETRYAIDADSGLGDVEIGEKEYPNGVHTASQAGSESITLQSEYGDIELEFSGLRDD